MLAERVVVASDERGAVECVVRGRLGDAVGLEPVGAGGDDVADAASGVVDVVLVAGDEVDVEVGDGLARGLADVDADVEAVGAVAGEDGLSGEGEGGGELGLLLGGGVEPGGDVAAGDEKGVAVAHGEGVPEGEDGGALVEDALGVGSAEGAGGCGRGWSRLVAGDDELAVEADVDAGAAAPSAHERVGRCGSADRRGSGGGR